MESFRILRSSVHSERPGASSEGKEDGSLATEQVPTTPSHHTMHSIDDRCIAMSLITPLVPRRYASGDLTGILAWACQGLNLSRPTFPSKPAIFHKQENK